MNRYALILAGGSGTRFWPLSRDHRPKQLIDLFGQGSLLRQAIDRLNGLIPPQNIFILTNRLQEDEVRRQAHELPQGNIVIEPVRRDTAPAIALGIGLIKAKDPNGVMLVLPSDQPVQDVVAFRSLMEQAMSVATQEHALVTVGIKPTWPCPSYGYIERGELLPYADCSCCEVVQFKEKPDSDTAAKYLEQGNFYWNAGMFVWTVPTVCEQLNKHCPALANFVDKVSRAVETQSNIDASFYELTPISIDFALMEHADRVLNMQATFDWNDLGSWISLAEYLPQYRFNAANTDVSVQDAHGNIVFSQQGNKHVALLGVENLIVVETADAILIADKHKADDIKKIVNQLPEDLR